VNRLSSGTIAAVAFTAIACGTGYAEEQRALVVEHASYRKSSKFDPGTIAVFVRNQSPEAMTVQEVLLDEIPLPVFGVGAPGEHKTPGQPKLPQSYQAAAQLLSGKRIIWASFSPNPIPQKASAVLFLKLANSPTRRSKIALRTGDQKTTVLVAPKESALRIPTIAFSEKLDRIYLYLRNHGPTPLEISGLWLDGQDVFRSAWRSSSRVDPGKDELAILVPPYPVARGAQVIARVAAASGETAEERVRAFPLFPICVQAGESPKGFYLEENPSTRIFGCPMHTYAGDLRRSAREILTTAESFAEKAPSVPRSVHVCRARPEEGYALFGQIADVMSFNPYITTATSIDYANESPEGVAFRLTRLAVSAAAPHVVHAVIPTNQFGIRKGKLSSPERLRKLVYMTIAAGAKGILYRHTAWSAKSPEAVAIDNEIKEIGNELRLLRPCLSIGHAVEWASSNDKSVDAKAILAGKDTLLLFCVNRGAEEQGNVTVTVALPRWLAISEVREVSGQKVAEMPFDIDKGRLILNLDSVPVTRQFLLGR